MTRKRALKEKQNAFASLHMNVVNVNRGMVIDKVTGRASSQCNEREIEIFLHEGGVALSFPTNEGTLFMSGDFLPVAIEQCYLMMLEEFLKGHKCGSGSP